MAPAERIRFQTETGSVYEVSRDASGMRWRRLAATLASGDIRGEYGPLIAWPEVVVGQRCRLLSAPVNDPFLRRVTTSRVVAIVEREVDGLTVPFVLPKSLPSFRDVRVGDLVTRMLGGAHMQLEVTAVDERFIHCGHPELGGKFDRDNGIEVDEEIGFGPQFGLIASYLLPSESAEPAEGAAE
jgi:hypothetical protein